MAAPGTPLGPSRRKLLLSTPNPIHSFSASLSPPSKALPLHQDANGTSTPRPNSANSFGGRAHTPGPDQMPLTIHTAAQRGDLPAIMRLVDSGRATVHDRDDDNITPLHWAAINAQLATCRYLLDHGAEVDALGGDLVSSPLQWAARNGHSTSWSSCATAAPIRPSPTLRASTHFISLPTLVPSCRSSSCCSNPPSARQKDSIRPTRRVILRSCGLLTKAMPSRRHSPQAWL